MLTENEIRPKNLMIERDKKLSDDVARLMRHRNEFVWVDCPACGSNKDATKHALTKRGIPYVTCIHCETLFANPRPTPEHLDEFYRESEDYTFWNKYIFPASENARREKIFKPRVEKILEICQQYQIQTNTIIDIGAGFGTFCEEMIKRNTFQQVIAVEPSHDLAETCRKRGIHVIEKILENIHSTDLDKTSINVVTNFEVIAQLFSPKHFLMQCANLMPTDSVLILTCPNSKGFDINVLGEKSSSIDIGHINLFNLNSLSLLLESCGFEVLEKRTPGRLDAELVRNKILSEEFDVSNQPFLKQILIDRWSELGPSFQQFLISHDLSSNMMFVAKRK
jgi:2-polyprenyl-3-methyl-5-hydroxy-6-metoxy-1,4-benzoquinol methylase